MVFGLRVGAFISDSHSFRESLQDNICRRPSTGEGSVQVPFLRCHTSHRLIVALGCPRKSNNALMRSVAPMMSGTHAGYAHKGTLFHGLPSNRGGCSSNITDDSGAQKVAPGCNAYKSTIQQLCAWHRWAPMML